jgi:hypothetical protein
MGVPSRQVLDKVISFRTVRRSTFIKDAILSTMLTGCIMGSIDRRTDTPPVGESVEAKPPPNFVQLALA